MLLYMYKQVSELLQKVAFDEIWSGFSCGAFALYDDAQVVIDGAVMPVDARFLGNTSIDLDGVRTAIWKLDGETDAERLAANIVHEMFHSHQMEKGELRYPDDLELLRLGVHAEELSLRRMECALLSAGEASLSKFADARIRRRAANPALTHQAERAETFEGMAEYAGLRALSMLSPEKFASACARIRARLQNPGEVLADARRMAYDTGAYLLLLAFRSGIDLLHTVGAQARTLSEIFLSKVAPEPAGAAPDLRAYAESIRNAREAECRAFLSASRPVAGQAADAPRRITGYDPMNMLRAGNFVLCRHFIMLDGELIRGPLLLEMVPGSRNEVLRVYMQA